MLDLEGKQAPDFALEGSDGKRHTLATYTGRYVVLYFYPKDNTPGCTKESCGFRDLSESFDNIIQRFWVSVRMISPHIMRLLMISTCHLSCSLTLIPR